MSVMDGILMITYYNQLRSTRHIDRTEAMFEAATQRMRPMLMTALSACIGLLPPAVRLASAVRCSVRSYGRHHNEQDDRSEKHAADHDRGAGAALGAARRRSPVAAEE